MSHRRWVGIKRLLSPSLALLAALLITVGCALLPAAPDEAAGDGLLVDEYGVRFELDPELAASVEATLGEAFVEPSGFVYATVPDHILISLQGGYADESPLYDRFLLNLGDLPQIAVYPTAAFAEMSEVAATEVEALGTLLASRPELSIQGPLPYLPPINAGQPYHAQAEYVEFENGAGVRYLTLFAQDARPVTNQDMLYLFQGLTDDGAYWVGAYFPVSTSALADTVEVDDWEAFMEGFGAYMEETWSELDASPADAFTPNLATLDALVASLRVEPTVELGGE